MSIRRATEADIAAIMEIERQTGFEQLVGRSDEAQHRVMMAAADAIYLLLEDDGGDAQGFAILQGGGSAVGNIYLKRMAVRTPGKGTGTAFLKAVIRRCFEEYGAQKFWLDAFEHNHRAHHVYGACGLTMDGVLREHYPMADGSRATLVIMSILRREWLGE
jgi:diamine N-acetyltransferase